MNDHESKLKTVGLTVSGRVQGVGFRYFVYRTAKRLGVSGWVKNLPNGSVELQATASQPIMDQLLVAISAGPPSSHVARVEKTYGQKKEPLAEMGEGFRILY